MGDFNNNALLRNEGYDYIIAKGMIDTYIMAQEKDSGITVKGTIDGWRECSEDKRLDLILSNKKIEVKDSKVIFNRENYIVSDHFGVEININLQKYSITQKKSYHIEIFQYDNSFFYYELRILVHNS